MSSLPGQAGCLLWNTKRSQEYLAQEGTHSLCELPRLPVGLLTPHIYLLHLMATASARDLPGSPPTTDTHPLPARAQVSLDPLSTSWAIQLRFHQRVSTPYYVISVPGWGWRQGLDGERMGVDSHGGCLSALASQMLLTTSQPHPQISWIPFQFSRKSCHISAFSRNPKLCGIQDSSNPPHATIPVPQAIIQIMESLTIQ